MSRAAADLDRRLGAMLQVGTVVSINNAKATARVQIGDLETIDIIVGQIRSGAIKIHWMPSVGEQVSVIAPSGDLARAYIMGSLPIDGNAVGPSADAPTMDLGGGTLRIIGNLFIDGDITVTGDVVANGISLTQHIHPESIGSVTGGPQ
jgi:phage baseplate assembly protein gpV